jgi:putative hydrolase of HD superfamily
MVMGDTAKADTERLIRMLLLHDLPETHTGDLDEQAKRQMGIKEVKSQEESAMMEIFSILPRELKSNYVSLLEEFEEQRTPEAVLANDIDKLEMVTQALTYEKEGHAPSKLDPFWESSRRAIKTPIAKAMYGILAKMRVRHQANHPIHEK